MIFTNEEIGEFWYDIKLNSLEPLAVEMDPIEAQVGKYENNFLLILKKKKNVICFL